MKKSLIYRSVCFKFLFIIQYFILTINKYAYIYYRILFWHWIDIFLFTYYSTLLITFLNYFYLLPYFFLYLLIILACIYYSSYFLPLINLFIFIYYSILINTWASFKKKKIILIGRCVPLEAVASSGQTVYFTQKRTASQ